MPEHVLSARRIVVIFRSVLLAVLSDHKIIAYRCREQRVIRSLNITRDKIIGKPIVSHSHVTLCLCFRTSPSLVCNPRRRNAISCEWFCTKTRFDKRQRQNGPLQIERREKHFYFSYNKQSDNLEGMAAMIESSADYETWVSL